MPHDLLIQMKMSVPTLNGPSLFPTFYLLLGVFLWPDWKPKSKEDL